MQEYNAAYRKRHREKLRIRWQKWKEAHLENVRQHARKARLKRKDKIRAYEKEYRTRPHVKDKVRYCTAKRRAKRHNATPPWMNSVLWGSVGSFYRKARFLQRKTGVRHHVDHIIPLRSDVVCGLHVPWNLQVLPAVVNQAKGNKIITNEQAVDRLHRHGQHSNVVAQFLVVEGSLDERVLAAVLEKVHTVHDSLDRRRDSA